MKGCVFRLIVLAVVAALLPSCHVTRPADPGRRATAALPGPDAWPDRDLRAVRGFHERTPEVIERYELSGLVPPDELTENEQRRLDTPGRAVLDNRLTDHGLFRVWRRPPRAAGSGVNLGRFPRFRLFPGMTRSFTPNASFLSERDATGFRLEDATQDVPRALGSPRREGLSPFVRGIQKTFEAESLLLDKGVRVFVPDPGEGPGKGVLVVLGGYLPSTWEDSSVDLFRRAGWRVILVETLTRVRGPNEDAYRRVVHEQSEWTITRLLHLEGLTDEDGNTLPRDPGEEPPTPREISAEERREVYEQANERFPLPPRGLELTETTDPAALGRTIAHAVDDAVAENAYAAAAAVRSYLDAIDPAGDVPIGVAGFSAGSLAAPSVAARLIEEGLGVDAMLLIGAGADIFEISQTNGILNGGINLREKDAPAPSPERIDAVREAYREHARLDPLALAPALADIPTLLMIAEDDQLVPNGDLLDERLGRPHRIRYFGGHGGLFYFLPQQTPRMIRWLDEAVSAR